MQPEQNLCPQLVVATALPDSVGQSRQIGHSKSATPFAFGVMCTLQPSFIDPRLKACTLARRMLALVDGVEYILDLEFEVECLLDAES